MENETEQISEYIQMTLDEIQINLRVLGDLKENEKLLIADKFLTIDQRYIQTLRRWMTADSRDKSIQFINNIISETQRVCLQIVDCVERHENPKENIEQLLRFQGLLNGALSGLGRLCITYCDDKLSKAKIETIQSNIRTFCDIHLKRTFTDSETGI